MAQGEVAFPNGTTWLDQEHEIIRTVYREGVDHDLKSAQEEIAAMAQVAGAQRYPVLVDITNLKSVSREARAYLARAAGESGSAVALLSRSSVGNMIGNVFLAVFGGQGPPTRLFSSE